MATSITVDIQGAMAEINAAETGLDTQMILGQIGQRLLKWVDDNFKAEGLESPWKPLSPNTVAGRRAGSSAILQDTGRLKGSFTMNVTDEGVSVGTNLDYAQYHEFGTGPYIIRPRSAKALRFMMADGPAFAKEVHHPGLAARPMLPSEETARALAEAVVQALIDKATGHGQG